MYHACKVMKAHECRPIARHKMILQEKESAKKCHNVS